MDEPQPTDLLIDVKDSALSSRARTVLASEDILTVGDLLDTDTCLTIKGVGRRTMREIIVTRRRLRAAGYRLP